MTDHLYLWIKALHLVSIIAWMAGLLYLPRLFVYHANVPVGSAADAMLQTMERRLLTMIMLPAMLASFVFGLWLMVLAGVGMEGWFHTKLLLVLGLAGLQGWMGACRRRFVLGTNQRSSKFYKYLNEIPTIFMLLIVGLVVLKPF